jgi:hypothetical protein
MISRKTLIVLNNNAYPKFETFMDQLETAMQ